MNSRIGQAWLNYKHKGDGNYQSQKASQFKLRESCTQLKLKLKF